MIFYLSGAGLYLLFLLTNFFKDIEADKRDRASWMVIAIASSIWIIAIPISILEINAKRKAKAKLDAMPKPKSFGSMPTYMRTIEQIDN